MKIVHEGPHTGASVLHCEKEGKFEFVLGPNISFSILAMKMLAKSTAIFVPMAVHGFVDNLFHFLRNLVGMVGFLW